MINDEQKVSTLRGLFIMFDPFTGKTDPLYALVHRLCERVHADMKFYKVFICVGDLNPSSTLRPTGESD
jgi:hypothetical protein